MSRIDKWHPAIGVFRAPLNAALTATSGPGAVTDLNRVLCVGLNGSGRVVKATTAFTVKGIIVATHAYAAGDIIDVLTNGEVVELDGADIEGGGAPVAGTDYIFNATASRLAAIGAPAAGTSFARIGWTVEATRLVVRLGLGQG